MAIPAYDAPADLGFADALKKTNIPLCASISDFTTNETADLCQWHVNETHYLEAWGDARAYDGTVSIVQPLIAPLYSGKSCHEFMALLSGKPMHRGYELVRAYWQRHVRKQTSRCAGGASLHDGWIAGTAFAPKPVPLKTTNLSPPTGADSGGIEINFRPRSFHLGRTIRQQRLAAGTAQADDEDHLGQSGAGGSEDGATG